MIQAVSIIGVIAIAIWAANKLVVRKAPRSTRVAAVLVPVILGFTMVNWGRNSDAPNVELLGVMALIFGLICAIVMTVLGITIGLARHRKGKRR